MQSVNKKGKVGTEGPKGRPEGGVNGSRLKILSKGKIGLVPKYTPNPRVLGTVDPTHRFEQRRFNR